MYEVLNVFFIVFHTVFILFNLSGWIWKATRRLHLATILLTAFSWFLLGIWYGFGYCFCTDWHWQVRRELGYHDMPNSYIRFLVELLTGIDIPAAIVDNATALLFFIVMVVSIFLNYRGFDKKKLVSK